MQLRQSTVQLVGAAGSGLEVLGRAAEPIELMFKEFEGRNKMCYRMRPLVIKNLSQDFLLSHWDLCTLGAIINTRFAEMIIPHQKGTTISIPLFQPPPKSVPVQTIREENIPARSEKILTVKVTIPKH